jgi:hypothetical protein
VALGRRHQKIPQLAQESPIPGDRSVTDLANESLYQPVFEISVVAAVQYPADRLEPLSAFAISRPLISPGGIANLAGASGTQVGELEGCRHSL